MQHNNLVKEEKIPPYELRQREKSSRLTTLKYLLDQTEHDTMKVNSPELGHSWSHCTPTYQNLELGILLQHIFHLHINVIRISKLLPLGIPSSFCKPVLYTGDRYQEHTDQSFQQNYKQAQGFLSQNISPMSKKSEWLQKSRIISQQTKILGTQQIRHTRIVSKSKSFHSFF